MLREMKMKNPNWRRCFVSLLCLTAFFCVFFGMGAVAAEPPLTVRVGLYENTPKIFTDEKGIASGFWPDIINHVASQEGWKIEYVPGTWTESLQRLEKNEIDVMPDVAYTEARKATYAFSKDPKGLRRSPVLFQVSATGYARGYLH
jgi:ABC-type amino acid transport substrate-binding protein